jgi:hypothetical protein
VAQDPRADDGDAAAPVRPGLALRLVAPACAPPRRSCPSTCWRCRTACAASGRACRAPCPPRSRRAVRRWTPRWG